MLKARAAAKAKRNKDTSSAAEVVAETLPAAEVGEGASSAPALPDSNLPPTEAVAAPEPSVFLTLAHEQIVPDPNNARRVFDHVAIAELGETIMTHGLLQPLVVRLSELERADGAHTLVAGERRWRAIGWLIAAGRLPADWPIPCRLHAADDRLATEAALIENLQRVDLNRVEAAEAFEALGSRFHLSNRVIADKIGSSIEFVQQHRRLMKLPAADREKVRTGEMKMHEALEILAKPTPDTLGPAATLAFAEIWRRCSVKGTQGWESSTEVAPWAGSDNALKTLIDRKLVSFVERDHSRLRAWATVTYYDGKAFAKAWFAGLDGKGEKADQLLRPFLARAGDDRFNPLSADYDPAAKVEQRGVAGYATKWLNGPFTLTSEAQEILDKRKAEQAEYEAQRAKAAAKHQTEEDERKAQIAEIIGDPQPATLAAVLASVGIKPPFVSGGGYRGEIVCAGEPLIEFTWQLDSDKRALAGAALGAMLTWAFEAAGWKETEVAETPAEAQEPEAEGAPAEDVAVSPAMQRLAGVPEAALEAAE